MVTTSNASPTGGFSSVGGGSFLVTPSGQKVGSADTRRRGRGGRSKKLTSEEDPAVLERIRQERLEEKRQEELKRRTALEERERVRKQKIQSGKLTGQFKSTSSESGALTLSQQEFNSLQSTPRDSPIFIDRGGSPSQNLFIGQSLSQIEQTPRIPGPIQPESGVKSRQEQISTFQAFVDRGDISESTAKRLGKKGAEEILDRRRTSDIISSRAIDVSVVGGGKAVLGVGQFATDVTSGLGTQKIEVKDNKIVSKDKIKLDAFNIAKQPSSIGNVGGTVLATGPFVVSGAKSFSGLKQEFGLAGATKETLSSISPFRVRSGSFGPLESVKGRSQSFENIKVIESKRPDGGTDFAGVGTGSKDPSVSLSFIQRQNTKGDVTFGTGFTERTAPVTTFRPATGFQDGTRTIVNQDVFKVTGSNIPLSGRIVNKDFKLISSLNDVTGTTSFSGSRTIGTAVNVPKGSFSQSTPNTQFTESFPITAGSRKGPITTFGTGSRNFKFNPGKGLTQSVSDFQVKGKILDVSSVSTSSTSLPGKINTGSFSPKRGGIGSSSSFSPKRGGIGSSSKNLQKSTFQAGTITKPSTSISFKGPKTTFATGTKLTTQTTKGAQVTTVKPGTKGKVKTTIIDTISTTGTGFIGGGRRGSKGTTIIKSTSTSLKPATQQDFKPVITTSTINRGSGRSSLDLKTQIGTGKGRGGGRFSSLPLFNLPGIGLPGIKPVANFGESRRRKSRKSKSRKTRVSPSLTGIALFDIGGITGPSLEGQIFGPRLVPRKKKKKKK